MKDVVRNEERQVVITGRGLLTPLGNSPEDLFAAALAKRSATGLEAGFATEKFTSRVFGTLPEDTDLTLGMRKDQVRYFRKNSKVMARDIQIAVGSAGRAIQSTGLPVGEAKSDPVLPTIDHTRFGILYGAGFIPCDLDGLAAATAVSIADDGDISLERWGRDGMPLMYPLWLLKYLPNMLSCHTGIIWDCQGPSNSVTCNDTGGLLAIGEAFRHVARGTADIMLTGAGESRINPTSMLRHVLLGKATIKGNEHPEAAQRPFDTNRDGYVCSEGAGTVVLEAAEHAAQRGASPLAVLAGFGSSCATSLPNVSEPSGRGIAVAIKAALHDAQCAAGDIGAVVARGAAVPEEDVAEATAIREVLGDVPVTTFSGGMGNVGCSGGPVGVAMAVEMIHRGCVPPMCNCDDLDPACPINAVIDGPLEKPLGAVAVLASTVGGQTAAMIVGKA